MYRLSRAKALIASWLPPSARVPGGGVRLVPRLAPRARSRGASTGLARAAIVLAGHPFSATNTQGPRTRYRRPLVLNLPTNHWESAHENIQCKFTNYRSITYAGRRGRGPSEAFVIGRNVAVSREANFSRSATASSPTRRKDRRTAMFGSARVFRAGRGRCSLARRPRRRRSPSPASRPEPAATPEDGPPRRRPERVGVARGRAAQRSLGADPRRGSARDVVRPHNNDEHCRYCTCTFERY